MPINLAVQLYTSSLPRRDRDFHPLERAHGAQTIRRLSAAAGNLLITYYIVFQSFTINLTIPMIISQFI